MALLASRYQHSFGLQQWAMKAARTKMPSSPCFSGMDSRIAGMSGILIRA